MLLWMLQETAILWQGSSVFSTAARSLQLGSGFVSAGGSFYPNPVSSELTLVSTGAIADRYEIINAAGEKVASGSINPDSNKLSFEGQSSGVYFILLWKTVSLPERKK